MQELSQWKPPLGGPLSCFVARFTPEQAKFILENHNRHNREMTLSYVNRYTKYMKSNLWMDGSEIGFDSDGNLDAGQKRLRAMIESDTTQVFVVTTGRNPNMREVIDGGQPATAANILTMREIVIPPHLKTVLSQPSKVTALAMQVLGLQNPRDQSLSQPTKTEQVEWVQKNIDMINPLAIKLSQDLAKGLRSASGPLIGAFLFLYPEFIQDFEHLLAMHQDREVAYPHSDPMAALKRWYGEQASGSKVLANYSAARAREVKAIAHALGIIRHGGTLSGIRAITVKNEWLLPLLLKKLKVGDFSFEEDEATV